jgi:hypothetical protein
MAFIGIIIARRVSCCFSLSISPPPTHTHSPLLLAWCRPVLRHQLPVLKRRWAHGSPQRGESCLAATKRQRAPVQRRPALVRALQAPVLLAMLQRAARRRLARRVRSQSSGPTRRRSRAPTRSLTSMRGTTPPQARRPRSLQAPGPCPHRLRQPALRQWPLLRRRPRCRTQRQWTLPRRLARLQGTSLLPRRPSGVACSTAATRARRRQRPALTMPPPRGAACFPAPRAPGPAWT